jgi:hypothetical protein
MNRLKNALVAAVVVCSAATGPAAAQSFSFANFSAEINANGVTAKGLGIQNSARTGLGLYIVSFMRDVTVCAIVASPRGTAGGQISAVKTGNNPNRVRFYAFSRTGHPTNLNFTVLVSCTQ